MTFKVLQSTRCRLFAAVISLGGSAVLQPVLSARDHPNPSAVTSHGQSASKPLRQERPIRVETTLVSLDVTVMDNRGRAVEGLEKEAFLIYEGGIEQQVSFFSREERPVSWGLVLDRSGSMREA